MLFSFFFYLYFFNFSNRFLIFRVYYKDVKRTETSQERMMIMTIIQVQNKKIKQEKHNKEKVKSIPVFSQNNINWFRKLKPQGS